MNHSKKMNINEKIFYLNLNNNCEEIEKIRNKLKLSKKRTKKLYKELNLIKQTKRKKKENIHLISLLRKSKQKLMLL